ncbi:hypothetical protein Droror1_Dr00015838 [Drosera rotundifolia]
MPGFARPHQGADSSGSVTCRGADSPGSRLVGEHDMPGSGLVGERDMSWSFARCGRNPGGRARVLSGPGHGISSAGQRAEERPRHAWLRSPTPRSGLVGERYMPGSGLARERTRQGADSSGSMSCRGADSSGSVTCRGASPDVGGIQEAGHEF